MMKMIPNIPKSALIMALVLLAACSQQAQQNEPAANEPETIAPAANEPAPETPVNPPAPGEAGGLPDDRTPVSEGPIDPKSAQGAGQVLQTYFALVEQGEFTEANNLWSDAATKLDLTKYNEVHANIGGPGNMEGAAGSSVVEYPVQLYGRTKAGKEFHSRGTMTLRRVNDVPGSTEEQRKWHIFKSDFPVR
jgi:hypothetical protein